MTTDRAGVVDPGQRDGGRTAPGADPRRRRWPHARCRRWPRRSGSGAGTFDAEHRGRRLRGARRATGRRPAAPGTSGTSPRNTPATDALLAERSRTAFLARAGSRLGLSLHRDQTLRATATLPVPYLADAAVVLHRRRRPPRTAALDPVRRRATPARSPGWPAGDADRLRTRAGRGARRRPHRAQPVAGRRAGRPGRGAAAPTSAGPGTVLISPMLSAGGPAGALILVRRPGRAGFDQRDDRAGPGVRRPGGRRAGRRRAATASRPTWPGCCSTACSRRSCPPARR